jgi:hypothetical protein
MKDFFKHFKGDVFGGLTAGIVALPLALAFGVSSGLGPSAGLYGAIFISFFAALFGGTPTQISGPTAPMTAVSMVIVAGIVGVNEGDVNKALPAINWQLFVPDYSEYDLTDEQLKQWAYLDLFDMLAPAYDRPKSRRTFQKWFKHYGFRDIDVHYGYNGVEGRGIKL